MSMLEFTASKNSIFCGVFYQSIFKFVSARNNLLADDYIPNVILPEADVFVKSKI